MKFYKDILSWKPYQIRMMAKDGQYNNQQRPLSNIDIADRSGLTTAEVSAISKSRSFDNIRLSQIIKFFTGCGFDPTNSDDKRRAKIYFAGGAKFKYLTSSEIYDREIVPVLKHVSKYKND